MASFTDQITQFTPYVQQLPVEEMVTVGMQKQAQYDQGVQKIQGYIDNIAGMDVVNDADKAYLQSKLNQLGGRLKSVAAADFSNQQLVNSVGGMATQIIKDPTVQNAVSSTAWYRKQLADMDKAIQEGKSSQANIYDFQQQANQWLSSGKAGQVFRGRYTPYTDVDKKMLDVIKQLHPGATSEDIAYAKDPITGQIDQNKIAAAMVRKGYEGVSETQIANAINASLTPDDINQLRLNANYQFRGYDGARLQDYAKKRAQASVSIIDSRIKELEGVAKQYASDATMLSQAQNSINELKKKKNAIELGLPSQLEEIAKNPEGMKYNIYKNGFVDSYSNAFSWEKNTVERLSNPVLAADHWEKEQAIRKANYNLDVRRQNWNEKIDLEKLGMQREELDFKLGKTYGGSFTTYAGENTNIDNPLVAMQKDINLKLQSANSTVQNLAKSLYGSASLENIGKAEKAIETYRNAGNDQQRNAIPKQWRNVVDQAIADRVSATNLENSLKQSEKNVMSDPSLIGSEASIKKALEGKKGITLTISGTPTYFSNKEIYDYLRKEQYTAEKGAAYTDLRISQPKGVLSVDEELLSPKERLLYNAIKGARYDGTASAKPSAAQSVILGAFRNYKDVIESGIGFESKKKDLMSKDLLSKTGKYIPAISPIFVGSDKESSMARTRMEGIASAVLSRYTRDKAGAEGLDTQRANSMLVGDNKNSIQYQKLVQGDKTYLVMKLGNEEEVIPLTPNEAASLPKGKDEKTSVDVDVTTLQALTGGVTNATGDPLNSYFQKVNFPNVKRLNVTADLTADKAAPSVQYMNINLKTPSGWKMLPLDDYPMDPNTAASEVGRLTDEKIIQLFLGSRNVPQSWKDEIKNLY